MHSIKTAGEYLNNRINEMGIPSNPDGLYYPIRYILDLGGKRIRPSLSILTHQLFSKNTEEVISPALGLEVFHNFTLIHDDIMDNAPIRRGKPTVHSKWNSNTAILSGDAMMILAYDLICKAPDHCLSPVLELFNKTALEVCEGQQYDMDFEKRFDVTEREYMNMIRLKTAVLIAASLKLGGIIGGGNKEVNQYLYDFGIAIGLAFQLQDDWLDSFGNQANFGKRIGGDIVENKKTLLLIKALEKAEGAKKDELVKWLSASEFNESIKIESILSIYNHYNISQEILLKIDGYFNQADDYLRKLEESGLNVIYLREFAEKLKNREY